MLRLAIGPLVLAACASPVGTAAPSFSQPGPSLSQSGPPSPPAHTPSGLDVTGRIVFDRWEPSNGSTAVYVANADGTGVRQLFARGAEVPHWSPDGKTVSVFCCDNGMAAHLIDPESGDFHELAPPDPGTEVHCGPWSADGSQLLCESFGVDDASRNGVYAIRSSDGRDLTQLTSNPDGDDLPGGFSPDGSHLVFDRHVSTQPEDSFALFVADLQGSGVVQVTPWGAVGPCFCGSYSPDGTLIVFASASDGGVWLVHPDGSNLRKLYQDAQGRYATTPVWSPDGKMIMFALSPSADTSSHPPTGLYVIDSNGEHLTQILEADSFQSNPDWAP